MSYDVTLFLPAGDAPLEEQVGRDEPAGAPTAEDRSRLDAIRASLVAYDPAVKFDEDVQDALIVLDGEKLPNLEIGPRRAALGMSMGTDSHALYQCLHEVIGLFAKHGFVAFDHQAGAIVKPNATFRAFMEQFRSQWETPAGFEAWFKSDRDEPAAAAQAAPAPQKKGVPALGIAFGVLILLWALYKLHKAGYFQP